MVWTVQFVSSTSVKDENGRRRDADERRELFCGSVDILLLYRRIFVNCEVRNGEGKHCEAGFCRGGLSLVMYM